MTENAKAAHGAITLERIYVKDISYEAPNVPAVFGQDNSNPQLGVKLGIRHRALEGQTGMYEVVLEVSASATQGDKTIFLAEVQQAGVFGVPGLNGEALERVLEIECPHVLMPFARETVNELVGKGGFPQLLISPINFAALHAQKRAAQTQKQKVQ